MKILLSEKCALSKMADKFFVIQEKELIDRVLIRNLIYAPHGTREIIIMTMNTCELISESDEAHPLQMKRY